MRDIRFIAIHLGGSLTIEKHRLLIKWAIECVERAMKVTSLIDVDQRAMKAIQIAKEWFEGRASVNEARKAAQSAHAAARECLVKSEIAIIRACGHTVATAHMADHSLRARDYLIKGLKNTLNKEDLEHEIHWQEQNADNKIKEMIENEY